MQMVWNIYIINNQDSEIISIMRQKLFSHLF